jgi:16S rRNA (cytosine1402-N4)-methyltransferase
MYHIPVLLNESIAGLNIRPDGIYIDATYGSGAHSQAILSKLGSGMLFAFDRDKDAEANVVADPHLTFIRQDFRFLRNFLSFHGVKSIDGLLADLGISSHQIDDASRGFSTRFDGPLDMRMDQAQDLDAGTFLNNVPFEKLTGILKENGELENARQVAEAIVRARSSNPIDTTEEFRNIILKYAPRGKENQFLARVFQAIRIEVNDELESLKELLQQSCELLNPGGRLAIIAYHSLEDRLVKNFFKTGNFEGIPVKDFFGRQVTPLKPVTRKAIQPSEGETASNPRSRSAKLRIAEKA